MKDWEDIAVRTMMELQQAIILLESVEVSPSQNTRTLKKKYNSLKKEFGYE